MASISGDYSSGLQAYWKFEEASGNRADEVNSNTLTDVNTVLSAAGKQGTAADFEKDNSENFTGAVAASVNVDDGWSVSYWVKYESMPTGGVGFPMYVAGARSGENGWATGIMTAGASDFRHAVWTGTGAFGNVNTVATVAVDTWYHIVVYYNGASTKIYINGAAAETLACTAITSPNNGIVFGRKPNGASEYFDGILDEFGIWNRELLSADVAGIYNGGSGIPYSASSPGAGKIGPFPTHFNG